MGSTPEALTEVEWSGISVASDKMCNSKFKTTTTILMFKLKKHICYMVAVAQLVEESYEHFGCGPRGCGFDSHQSPHKVTNSIININDRVVQW